MTGSPASGSARIETRASRGTDVAARRNVLNGGERGGLPPARDEEEAFVRRWLRIADDMVRGERGRKGGRREEPDRTPQSEHRDGPNDGPA